MTVIDLQLFWKLTVKPLAWAGSNGTVRNFAIHIPANG